MTGIEPQALRAALPDRLETARLILRAPDLSDAPALALLANNRKIHEMLSRLPHPYGEDDATTFISDVARSQREHAYAIISREHGLVGIISLMFAQDDIPEIGYWIGEPYWDQGFASEAARAVLDASLGVGPVSIKARAIAENTGSRKLLEKLGFTFVSQSLGSCGPHKGVEIVSYRFGPAENTNDQSA